MHFDLFYLLFQLSNARARLIGHSEGFLEVIFHVLMAKLIIARENNGNIGLKLQDDS